MNTRFLSIVAVVFIAVATATIMTTQAVSALSNVISSNSRPNFLLVEVINFSFAKITQNGVTTPVKLTVTPANFPSFIFLSLYGTLK